MWQILLLFLLASSVYGAAQRRLDQSSDNSKESDDDYYNDSENDDNIERDALKIDIDIDYARQKLMPSYLSYRSAYSPTTPPYAHLRRVPRHPWESQHSASDNYLDAAVDEVSRANSFEESIKKIITPISLF